jgi:hypothetical protein
MLAYYGDVLGTRGAAGAAGSSQHNAAAGLWAAVFVFLGEQGRLKPVLT